MSKAARELRRAVVRERAAIGEELIDTAVAPLVELILDVYQNYDIAPNGGNWWRKAQKALEPWRQK